MKKFSREYFENKFRIISNRLLVKQGFIEDIKKTRENLGLPENGFNNEIELAIFMYGKMRKDEKKCYDFMIFSQKYKVDNKVELFTEEEEKKLFTTCFEKFSSIKDYSQIAINELSEEIKYHHHLISKILDGFEENKFISKLYPETLILIKKFWGIDLLDQHVTANLVDRYLFLGDYGITQYIRDKISCPNCRYLGVNHFSPTRSNMVGKYEGVGSKNYIFNKQTVKQLSSHFDSVFLIIKPYATKEEVINYIEDNWHNLKEHVIEKNTFYKQYDINIGTLKKSDLDKRRLIYELYKTPKKELIKIYKGEKDLNRPHIYKESIISAILDEQYNINMSADAIKKSATRFSKSTSIKKEPKDIEDIRDI